MEPIRDGLMNTMNMPAELGCEFIDLTKCYSDRKGTAGAAEDVL